MPSLKRDRKDEGSESPKRVKTDGKDSLQVLKVDVPHSKDSPEGDTYWEVSSNPYSV